MNVVHIIIFPSLRDFQVIRATRNFAAHFTPWVDLRFSTGVSGFYYTGGPKRGRGVRNGSCIKYFGGQIGTLYWQEWLLGPPRGQHGSTWTFGTSYMLVSHTKINFSISATKSMYKKKGFIQDCLIHCSIFMKEYRSVQIDKYIVKIYQIRSIDSFQPTQF